MGLIVYFSPPCHCYHRSFLSVFISLSCICYVSIYKLSDLVDLSYLIGLPSRTVQQYSPPACFFQNKVMFLQRIVLIYDEPPLSSHLPVLPEWLLNGGTNIEQLHHKNAVANEHKI